MFRNVIPIRSIYLRPSIRCYAAEYQATRFNFGQRQQQTAPMDEEEEGAVEASHRRTTGFQPVSMNPPNSAPTCIFPEESKQAYSIEDYPGVSAEPFPEQIARILQEPVAAEDIEVKPDGAIYLPEIKYRKILTQAFGPGGWALVPRGPHTLNGIALSREYALFCRGRFVSQARGSSNVQGQATPASSTEAVRSNALMRCCKDLGIASELWDRNFVNQWKERFSVKKTVADRYGNSKVVWMKTGGN